MAFNQETVRHWEIPVLAGLAILVAVFVLTRKSPSPVSPTATALGSDASSLLSDLASKQQAQSQALADLENANAQAIGQAFLQGYASVATGLQELQTQLQQGFSTLKPPTVTLNSLIPEPTVEQLKAIEAAGGADDTKTHKQKFFLTESGQYYLCSLAAKYPQAFPGIEPGFCKGVPS